MLICVALSVKLQDNKQNKNTCKPKQNAHHTTSHHTTLKLLIYVEEVEMDLFVCIYIYKCP